MYTRDLVAMRKPGCVEAAMTAGLAQLDMISSFEEEQRTTTSLWPGLTVARVIFKKTKKHTQRLCFHCSGVVWLACRQKVLQFTLLISFSNSYRILWSDFTLI